MLTYQALWPEDGGTLDELIARANKAEHTAKAKGKNQVEVYQGDRT
jgi:PleD family two-component response regulator